MIVLARSKYVRIFGPLGCLLTECCKCRYRAANYQQKRVNAGFLQRLFGMLPLDVRKIVPIHALNPLEGKVLARFCPCLGGFRASPSPDR
jgi:hypothetical protein